MDIIIKLLMNKMVIRFLGLGFMFTVIWVLGPLLSLVGITFLNKALNRVILMLVVGVLMLLWGLIAGWRQRRANAQLLSGGDNKAARLDQETAVLEQRFSEALQQMEDSARQSGKRSFFNRSGHLYELPWYMFVGAPGSGKTTALLNAGLTFPLAGKMGQGAVRGVGGTRNCEWWFTEQAILIDTAGRYATQDSDADVDAGAWQDFLKRLRKARPRRPLNGILLTVNVQDLLQQAPAERREQAAKLRARLQELHAALGVRPPIYVMVTKCDLIAGFNETFESLGREDREQVWGFSFAYQEGSQGSALQDFNNEFSALEKRLRERLIERIEADLEPLRRVAIFAFPAQFGGLKGLLGGFLEQVFEGGLGLEEQPVLRGVYFTSGTQEGSPIDRVLGTLARTFGVEGTAAALGGRGKSYFLTRLLRDVVFAERELVGENQAMAGRQRLQRQLALGALALVALVAVAGWAISYQRNVGYVNAVGALVPGLRTSVAGLPAGGTSNTALLPPVLDQIAAAQHPAATAGSENSWLNGLGLSQVGYIGAGQDIGYHRVLDHALLPRVAARLEERLRTASRDNLEFSYEALKAYLMLYTPDHFDRDALKAWVTLDWDTNLSSTLTPEQRASLAEHLDAALSQGAPQALAPMDKTLVSNVRDMLAAYPLEVRIVSRLKRARTGADMPEFTVIGAGGPAAANLFERTSGQPLTRGIPGLFTRDGYIKGFRDASTRVTRQLADEESWVMGHAATPVSSTAALETRVRQIYLQEYIKVWDAFLADVHLVKLTGLDRSIAVAAALANVDSPLVAYLRAAARETQLAAALAQAGSNPLDKARAAADAARAQTGAASDKAKQDLAALTGAAPPPPEAAGSSKPVEQMVDDHFAWLQKQVSGNPAPVDEQRKLFSDVYNQLSAIDAAQKSKTAPPPGGGGAIKAAAGMQPEPVKSMLMALADSGANQSQSAERAGLSGDLKPIAEQCHKTIAGRFPFALGARADALPDDFGQIFGVGGLLDDFYQRKLAALVDTGAATWTYKPLPDGTKPAGGAALADFQRAARIRDAFFRGGGKQPGFKVDLRVLDMADGLKEINLDIDGQVMHFTAGSTVAQTLAWPSSRVASQIRLTGAPGGTAQVFEGPWALFRLINQFEVQPSPQPERFIVVLPVDGKKARLEVIASSALNPLRLRDLQAFRCPDAL